MLHDSDAGMQAAAVASKYRVSAFLGPAAQTTAAGNRRSRPAQQRYGRHPVLAPQLHTLAALIREQPDRTLADLQVALGTSASLATIWRAVKQLGFTVKKTVRASEHDRPDVAAARAQWATTARRSTRLASSFWMKAGRHQSPAALWAQPSRPAGRRSRAPGSVGDSTFIAALRVTGLTAPGVLDGPIDGASFLAYVETDPRTDVAAR